MTTWEPPRPTSTRRRVVAALAAVGVFVTLAAVQLLGSSADPPERLEVEQRPTAAPRADEAVAWRRLRPGLWRPTPAAPLTPRVAHAMVSTDRGVFVWGGFDAAGLPLADGALFDPSDGSWQRLPATEARDTAAHAAWTGRDVMIVTATGTQRYDPARAVWQAEAPLPLPRGHVLTDQVLGAGGAVIALTRPTADGIPPRPAVFMLRPGARDWRRLPDPPVRFLDGDIVLADDTDVLLYTRPTAERPAAAVGLRHTNDDARWSPLAPPPGIDEQPVAKLVGARAGDRTVLWVTDTSGAGGFTAVDDGERWRRLGPPPIATARQVDALAVGDGVLMWDRQTGAGATLDLTAARWTRLAPSPVANGFPRPAVWNGSSLVTWGGFDGGGALFRVR